MREGNNSVMAGRSIVNYFSDSSGYKCGYCGSEDTSLSNGMWAHSMTVEDYQDLIDRGWRRSGQYCYKPTMKKTCCPQYAIKCDALKYVMTKSHKKVIKRVNKYLNTGIKPGSEETEQPSRGGGEEQPVTPKASRQDDASSSRQEVRSASVAEDQAELDNVNKAKSGSKSPSPSSSSSAAKSRSDSSQTSHAACPKKIPRPGDGPDPTRPQQKKAKLLRIERKREKLALKGQVDQVSQGKKKDKEGKTLEELLQEVETDPMHKLELRLVRSSPRSKEFQESFNQSYDVYKKYQIVIHGDPPDKPTLRQFTRFLVDSPLQIKLVRSSPCSDEFKNTFKQSHKVYKKYQMIIHKDPPEDCDQESFTQFLVDSPLQEEHHEGGFEPGFGSFHQQYWLDGTLIAVGVIDILPKCVSSVYLYYDPDYTYLSLGTYSALREFAFTRQIQAKEPGVVSYYMGYYIQSCPKMVYKGQYTPSFLLCPESYTWHPIEKCRPKLDAAKYARFDETGAVDVNGNIDLDKVLLLHSRQAMPYSIYKALNPEADDQDEIEEYATFVGKPCAERMLMIRM